MAQPSEVVPPAKQVTAPPDLCDPFLTALPVSGASITVVVASGARLTLSSSDQLAARIDELQFQFGEGPQLSAFESGTVVMIPDVGANGQSRWPVFGAALAELGIGALYCVPIRMGAVTLGVATLYRTEPRHLTRDQQTTALAIASAIACAAAHQALRSAGDDTTRESATAPALRREVHQATGIALVQLDTTATVAYARLQAYAFANDLTIQAVARQVVDGTLTFDDSTP